PAQTPTAPIGSRIPENVALASAIGLVLAASAAFLIEYLDDPIKPPEKVRAAVGEALLGSIAGIPGRDYPDMLSPLKRPRSPVAEAYRMLRTNLQFSAIDHPLNTLMVTSSNPLEGKSITAANL